MESEHQIPIWFFIGAMLFIYGLIICIAGIYEWIFPPDIKIALYELHAAVWWGALLTALGAFYLKRFWPSGTKES